MDYTGTRRDGRDEESIEHAFFREVCEELISRVHPIDWKGPRGNNVAPQRHQIISSWRLAGYCFATHLLPKRAPETAIELDSFIEGLRQRFCEYETEHLDKFSQDDFDAFGKEFDLDACDKVESRGQKLLRLSSHFGTPAHEAASAALGIVKMVTNGDLVLLSLERVRHLAQRLTRLDEAFRVIRLENPSKFLYGTHEQRKNGE
jgi:hypothetical protein